MVLRMLEHDPDTLDKLRRIAEQVRRLPAQIAGMPKPDLDTWQDFGGRMLSEALNRRGLSGDECRRVREAVQPHLDEGRFAAAFATAGELLWPADVSHAPGAVHCFATYCAVVADAIERELPQP